jgi:hypothetical protein
MAKSRDPATPEEWQEAVDAAKGLLVMDAARQYGLVTGGPGVDAARCAKIIVEGAKRGFRPAADAIERVVCELASTGNGEEQTSHKAAKSAKRGAAAKSRRGEKAKQLPFGP